MKHIYIILIFLPILVEAQSWKDLKKVANTVNREFKQKSGFSEEDAVKAIKETLSRGTDKGVNILAINDGYFGNPEVKIPFPENAKEVADKLIQLGMRKQVNDVVLTINRAAEDAVIAAKPIFIEAIKKININDGIGIIKGHKTAGTDYLSRNTSASLSFTFKPIIKSSLEKVHATKYWKNVITTYNKIPFIKKINPELESYVTEKAIKGLFLMLAKEEIIIRENPKARTTEILKKVFGN